MPDPRVELTLTSEARVGAYGARERLLHRLAAVLMIAQQRERDTPKPRVAGTIKPFQLDEVHLPSVRGHHYSVSTYKPLKSFSTEPYQRRVTAPRVRRRSGVIPEHWRRRRQ